MDRPLLQIAWGLFLGCCLMPGAHAKPPIRVGVLESIGTDDPSADTPGDSITPAPSC